MINEIIKIDRLMGMSYRMLLRHSSNKDIKILNKVDKYLEHYCKYSEISPSVAVQIIGKFQEKYADDVKEYINTGSYPHESNNTDGNIFKLTREEYDIVLICSVLTSRHRLKIISSIASALVSKQSVAVIGVGSGVELLFVNAKNIDAFDLSISSFVKMKFNGINLYENKFESVKNKYDTIFAVEILEHLNNPFSLLKEIHSSLKLRGKCIFTTTTNVPQFDHLYDFKIAELKFFIKDIGFKIVKHDIVKHDSKFQKIDAFNEFFIVEKVDA
jgi:hypothetical protein